MKKSSTLVIFLIIGFIFLISGIFIISSLIKNLPLINFSKEIPWLESFSSLQKSEYLTKADFKILVPPGWKEVINIPKVLALVVKDDIQEGSGNQFQSYYAVTHEFLKDEKFDNYLLKIKDELFSLKPEAKLETEGYRQFNDKNFYTLEISFNENTNKIKGLIVLIPGKNNDLWAITFNTLETNWDKYQALFDQIVASFSLE